MEKTLLLEKFKNKYPLGRVLVSEPMKNHVSFRIGGEALMFFPKTEEELAFLLAETCGGTEPLVIGNGTNLLVSDEPLPFPVICTENMDDVSRDGEYITASCGSLLSKTAVFAMNCGLGGMEFAHGIPGSVGGAVFMNAGAYGGEMKDIVVSVRAMDRSGNIREYSECGFSYRHSRFEESGEIVVSAKLHLLPKEKSEISAKMEELGAKRRASQPLNMPSAGSTFKRPCGGYAAALIEQAGLKGFEHGSACVSPKHSGFVVNNGGATFREVLELMDIVRKKVYENSGIMLEPEVRIIR